ncbi:hypothetical protein Tco_1124137 [Tanacetum coccineum]|uniref:Transposase (Putative), gypsy type n=1 Tax=Tanacetum coccineum TaxID=301880 RepID=A0ABQ5J5B4_9ASTR
MSDGPKSAPCLARVRDNRVLVDVGSLPRMFLGLRKTLLDSGSGILQPPRRLALSRCFNILVDLLSFIQTADPTKVRVGERQRAEDEPKLLDTTMGRVVPLLPIAPARAESELDASVKRLFDEGGSGNLAKQGDSASGGHGVGIPLVSEATKTVAKYITPGYRTLSVTSVGGKSRSAIQRLLAGAVHNVEVRGEPIPTLPFVTSFVSATPEFFSSFPVPNSSKLRVEFFCQPSVPLMTVATTVTSTVDPATTVKEKLVESSIFGGDSSEHEVSSLSLADNDIPESGAARQMSLSAEVTMRAEYNIRERRRLNSVVEEKNSLLKARDVEIETLKARLLVKEAEAVEAIRLQSTNLGVKVADLAASVKVREQEVTDLDAQVAFAKSQSDNLAGREKVTAYENCMGKLEELQDEQIRVMNDKFEKWLLTYGVKLVIVKCLHSPEYLSALGAVISRASKKGMQDGLAARITHGYEGRVLTNIFAFNPSTKSDYISGLQELQDVNFSLLSELKSNKDASTETLMNILRLDEPLAERLGLDESQSHVDQLLVPIHYLPDRTVIGATSLLFSLDVSRNRVQKIRDYIANHRSSLHDVFVPLVEPLSSAALKGTEGTSGTAPETTTTLSVTFASTSSIPPISTDDYDVVHADGQEGRGADDNPFPNVDNAELNID